MASRFAVSQLDLICDALLSSPPLSTSQIARIADYSPRSVRTICSNLHCFGNVKALPMGSVAVGVSLLRMDPSNGPGGYVKRASMSWMWSSCLTRTARKQTRLKMLASILYSYAKNPQCLLLRRFAGNSHEQSSVIVKDSFSIDTTYLDVMTNNYFR